MSYGYGVYSFNFDVEPQEENDVNDTEYSLDEQLVVSSAEGNLEKVKECIQTGANVHAYNGFAFQCASLNGHFQIVKYLLEEAGADVRARYSLALHWAFLNNHIKIVIYLLNAGGNPLNYSYDLRNYLPVNPRKRFLL
jgi:ankyrin repeat protein